MIRAFRRHPTFHPLTVTDVERLTADAVTVTFAVPPDLVGAYRFVQGQHVTLRALIDGQDVRRSYSICSPATERGRLRVAVKRLPGGAFSAWVNEHLQPGGRVEVMTPTGRFHVPLDPSRARHHCAVAAGSGITPVLSLVATTLEVEPQSRFTLVYGNRTTAEVMFLEELADLKDRYPERLQLLHVLSREPQESELLSGRITRARLQTMLESLVPVDDVDEWFLCGPFGMVEECRATLLGAGASPGHVHVELFHVEVEGDVEVDGEGPRERGLQTAADDDARSTVTALLDGRATTVAVARTGERVLDAVLRVRADAPYACRGGVCGTCRAKVVAGQVRMDRNYALEPDEVAAGFVLACQSHPDSDEVTLDFDA